MANSPNPRSVFLAAVEISSPEERQAYLNEACAGDDELRQRVAELLQAHDDEGSLLDKPAVSVDPADKATLPPRPIAEGPGTTIGPYKLLQQIGEGGMGVVYLAEQDEPVRRRVALKIIKPGMDTRQVIARFEAERQALAMMDHINIARVLDAGATETGRPYFVMELVKGTPITSYCDGNRLNPRERLELFVPVCQAIQHAHQKGIIHRDIKPSNVLVCLYDGKPVPKVIDFGVAKAIEQRLTEKTMFTQHGQIVGTLEYMSPEQAEMSQLDIDTRSDIYSLGVMLYELLTGSTPITKEKLRAGALAEMLIMICELEPDRPSTRLSESGDALPTISAQRKTEPKKLSLLLRGELDWIVMKALEKDRTRRYESAIDFARDVENFLNDDPVEACPPSTTYRLRKMARRHRTALATVATFAVLLIVGTSVSTTQAIRARRAEQQSRFNAEQAIGNEQLWLDAAQQASNSAAEAMHAAEETRDTLARSYYEQARAVRLAGEPGRRWEALQLLQQAEELRSRERDYMVFPGAPTTPTPSKDLPGQSELRNEAVASLLLQDGRVSRQWDGHIHAVSPCGEFVATATVNTEEQRVRVVNVESGEDAWTAGQNDLRGGFPLVMAVAPRGRRLVWFSTRKSDVLELIDLTGREEPQALSIPGTGETAELEGGTEESNVDDSDSQPKPPGEGRRVSTTLDSLNFSPDDHWLVGTQSVGGGRSNVLLWDLHNDAAPDVRVLATVDLRTYHRPAFSPDSRSLAWVDGEGVITLWDLSEQKLDHHFEVPLYLDGVLDFTPDGTRLIAHGHHPNDLRGPPTHPGSVVVWDLAEDQAVSVFSTSPTFFASALSVSPDGERLVTGQMNGELLVFDLADGSAVPLDHGGLPQMLAWRGDGRQLTSAGMGVCKVWALATDTPLMSRRLQVDARGRPLTRFAVSPDGLTVATELAGARAVELNNLQTGGVIRTLPLDRVGGPFESGLLFSPDAGRLVRFRPDHVLVWDFMGDAEPLQISPEVFRGSLVTSAAFRSDGVPLLAGFDQHHPMVKEAISGDIVWKIDERSRARPRLSPDGSLIVFHSEQKIGNGSRMIEVRRLPAGDAIHQIPSAAGEYNFRTLAEVGPGNRWLIEIELASAMQIMGPNLGAMQSVAGHIYGATDESWQATLWDVETGEQHCRIEGDSNVEGMAFSPNGRYFAVTQRDGNIVVWDIENSRQLFQWQAWTGSAAIITSSRQLAFSSDGNELAFAAETGPAIRFLDLQQLNRELDGIGLGW